MYEQYKDIALGTMIDNIKTNKTLDNDAIMEKLKMK